MALHTPRRLPAVRPSLASHFNTASSPNLSLSASAAVARKASLNALTGVTSPGTDMAMGQDLQVGDLVDVPGGMHGTVRFIGSVRGKKGVFAGVELSREFAARGKNDGDVDGTHYFTTSIPGAGIFLPLHRASKRTSGPYDHSPTPNFASSTLGFSSKESPYSPPTPSIPKFSQSVGPGARAPSPVFKAQGRPSLPRPESPIRRGPNFTPNRSASATPASFSKSAIGAPRFAASPGPGKTGINKPRTPGPVRPFSRNNSRLGHHDAIDEDSEMTTSSRNRGSDDSAFDITPRGKTSSHSEDEVQTLTKKLEQREKQLKEQADSLSEMETSLQELQALMSNNESDHQDADAMQLRALLREKNEKISMLTAEFDAHRADFRSTIDTLELASTETVRVYEKKVSDLMQELNEIHDRGEDVESVAIQLKQLEELVQELEEGLEDARRGEAEARGEVEFLRGEVERGRSELRREREKAAAALKGAGAAMDSKEVAQRDDEIRGLKAIIHSLSSGADGPGSPALKNGGRNKADSEEMEKMRRQIENLEREKGELRSLVERKAYREEELEQEIQRLRLQNRPEERSSLISNAVSEKTAVHEHPSSGRDSKATITSWRSSPQAARHEPPKQLEPIESDTQSSVDGSVLWCEICETGGHDILNCTAMGNASEATIGKSPAQRKASLGRLEKPNSPLNGHHDATTPTIQRILSPGNAPTAPLPNPYDSSLVAGKGSREADPAKWCALCERDGHDATACPFEDAF